MTLYTSNNVSIMTNSYGRRIEDHVVLSLLDSDMSCYGFNCSPIICPIYEHCGSRGRSVIDIALRIAPHLADEYPEYFI